MSVPHTVALLHQVNRWLAGRSADTADEALVRRFAQAHDEQAFATLLARHGPMVLGVCRRLLGNPTEVEDAFQATFLVFARRAGAIAKGKSVGPWLHGVAARVARRMRAQAARRTVRPTPEQAPEPVPDGASWREVSGLLDEELGRLPEHLRGPLVLCYLEGQTRDQAAQQLGMPLGTLKMRLEQGRDRLHRRLAARGVELSAVLLAIGVAAAPLPAALVEATVQIVARKGAVATASALRLAEETLRCLAWAKVRWVTALLLTLCMAITAATVGTLKSGHWASEQPLELASAMAAPEDEHRVDVPAPRMDRHGDPLPPEALARLGTARLRHGNTVLASAFLADGKTLVSAGDDGMIRRWEVGSGKQLQACKYQDVVNWATFAPDGKTMISAAADDVVRFWEVSTGKQLRAWPQPTPELNARAFSPDGSILASVGVDKAIHFWNVATGAEIRAMEHQQRYVFRVAFTPDGRSLASAGQDGTVQLWDVTTGQKIRGFVGHKAQVNTVAFSRDGKFLASGDADRSVRLWEVASGNEVFSFPGHQGGEGQGAVQSVTFSPDGKALASVGFDDAVRIWEIASGKQLQSFALPKDLIFSSVMFTPDGKSLVTAGGQVVHVWDLATGKEIPNLDGHQDTVRTVAYSPDGKLAASGGQDSLVRLWDLASGKELHAFKHSGAVEVVAFAPDGKTLATAGYEQPARLWDLTTFKETHTLGHRGLVLSLAFAPDGKSLISAGSDGSAQVWDVASGKPLRTLPLGGEAVTALAFSPDGKSLATTNDVGAVRCWGLVTGEELQAFPGFPKLDFAQRFSLTFSPDGKSLALARKHDGTIRMLDLATGKEIQACRHSKGLYSVAFAPDGMSLVSAGDDRKVRWWDVASGLEIHAFAGHQGAVYSVAFAPDGKSLLSGSSDTTLLVWAPLPTRQVAAVPANAQEWQALWDLLRDDDPARAWQAIGALVRLRQQSVDFLRDRAKPLEAPSPKRLRDLLTDLASDRFAVREKATAELAELGDVIEADLRRHLKSTTNQDLRRRLEALLERKPNWSGERLRLWRVIQILEAIGTPESEAALRDLTLAEPENRLTREAEASLRRLAPRRER